MNNIKDYREKELKNYVIGNVLFFLVFSGKIQKIIEFGINNSVNIWGTIIESALLSSIIYIYIFLSLVLSFLKFDHSHPIRISVYRT